MPVHSFNKYLRVHTMSQGLSKTLGIQQWVKQIQCHLYLVFLHSVPSSALENSCSSFRGQSSDVASSLKSVYTLLPLHFVCIALSSCWFCKSMNESPKEIDQFYVHVGIYVWRGYKAFTKFSKESELSPPPPLPHKNLEPLFCYEHLLYYYFIVCL